MSTTDDKLIYMANQIAAFFAAQGKERAVPAIAVHLNRFWDPHMRKRFLEIAADHKATMAPLVAEALQLIKVPTPTQ
jgi:formate dehydrogenase subunit delta